MPRSLRLRFLIAALACLCVGGTIVANIALLGLADRPQDRIGNLTMRAGRPAAKPATTTSPPPPIVKPAPGHDGESGPDD
jgi:hypothetical protein